MIRGVIPVLYSYFGTSGALDPEAHDRQIDWVMRGGAAGVTLLGLASEGASLTQDERKSVITRTARRLAAEAILLVTTRPDDDLHDIARIALESRRDVGLIVQIGADPAPSIAQIRGIAADPSLASSVSIGLQLAPGLIDTAFSAASLQALPDVVQRVGFLKAEYNSIELDQHLRAIGKTFDLLVGRNGQNIIDYLRIGATGVIPGPEMTAPLCSIVRRRRRHDDAVAGYGKAAPYIDFAMQDLDTVIDVGRAVTGSTGTRARPLPQEGEGGGNAARRCAVPTSHRTAASRRRATAVRTHSASPTRGCSSR